MLSKLKKAAHFVAVLLPVIGACLFVLAAALIIVAVPNPGPGLMLIAVSIWYGCERIADALRDNNDE